MKKEKVYIVNKSKYPVPEYATEGSAGVDLYANVDYDISVDFGRVAIIPTGVYVSIPKGYEIQVRARSGLAFKHGISLVNGIGTIDSDYRGEICVALTSVKNEPFMVTPGMRIAQMVMNEYVRIDFEEVDNIDETDRGEGGFGHTGI